MLKNYIIGGIHKYPKMLANEFNDMLTPMAEKCFLENKEGYVMVNLNANLMNYETDNPKSYFVQRLLEQFLSIYQYPYSSNITA